MRAASTLGTKHMLCTKLRKSLDKISSLTSSAFLNSGHSVTAEGCPLRDFRTWRDVALESAMRSKADIGPPIKIQCHERWLALYDHALPSRPSSHRFWIVACVRVQSAANICTAAYGSVSFNPAQGGGYNGGFESTARQKGNKYGLFSI
jgi:hypothetical protein